MKYYEGKITVQNYKEVTLDSLNNGNCKTVFRFFVPYHLLLDPDQIYEIKMPATQNVHLLQAISRIANTAEITHKLYGIEFEDRFRKEALFTQAGDRFGHGGLTRIQITYNRHQNIFDKENQPNEKSIEKAVEKCCEIFNYFLDRYAAVTKHRQLNKISRFDIHTIEIDYFDKISNEKLISTQVTAMHGATLMGVMVSAPPKVNDRLRELLLSPESNLDSIAVNAIRSVFSGDYLNGIVQAVTQLEAFLYMVFNEEFKIKGINNSEGKLKSLGLANLLDMLPLVLANEKYQEIEANCDIKKIRRAVTIRNDFIHKAENNEPISSFEQAEEFVDAITVFCIYISRLYGNKHMMDEAYSGWN
ncbi:MULTISPECIES: hypothetical protein [Paenibacillus]|uniref:Uncharacterized protein n=1 Tax=Paenibacillus validus TaxID=44253 RepID=A0A7X2ZBB9_9BACL|nr:hypothetical protein [Paenibacillus validus]MUG71778.1 hypothetical protein [Paenibacillus validus]